MTLKRLMDYFQKEEQATKVSLVILAVVWVLYFTVFLPLDGKVAEVKELISRKMVLLAHAQGKLVEKRLERDKFTELRGEIEKGILPKINLRIYKGDVLAFMTGTASKFGVRLDSIKPKLGKKSISIFVSGSAEYYAFVKFLLEIEHSEYLIWVRKMVIRRSRGGVNFRLLLVIYGEVK